MFMAHQWKEENVYCHIRHKHLKINLSGQQRGGNEKKMDFWIFRVVFEQLIMHGCSNGIQEDI